MDYLNRRSFLKISSAGALVSPKELSPKAPIEASVIDLTTDGLNLSPQAYAELLARLAIQSNLQADYYSQGSCIEELEQRFAKLLNKEAAIFMPTGTLANHLAIRTLSGSNTRVLVQNESHMYNDSGDCAQSLTNLNLIPLGDDKATFTLDEVKEIVGRTASGRVATKIGAISIESPVRRKAGEQFDYEQMKQIAQFARANGIKMHLDGARIFLASAYSGIPVATYASLFDTVYVSLYKYFNAASGAILAGDKERIAPMFHTRRMFGSGLHQAWVFASVALHYMEGFEERYAKAVIIAEELVKKLSQNDRFDVQRISNGTNIFRLSAKNIAAKVLVENLQKRGVIVKALNNNTVNVLVNETLLKTNANDLYEKFLTSIN